MTRLSTARNAQPDLTIHIIGDGIPALMSALDAIELGQKLGRNVRVIIYGSGTVGGGGSPYASSWKCQLWLHRDGQLYVLGQPDVVQALRFSTRRLRRLAPHAFNFPVALAIEPRNVRETSLSHFYQAAQVPFKQIPTAVAQNWYKMLPLNADDRVYRIGDGTIDLPMLAHTLRAKVQRHGVAIIPRRITRLHVRGNRISAIVPQDAPPVVVGPHDEVVLACGAAVRPLLASADLTVPGLRLFQSYLTATTDFGLNLLVMVHGIANCVPHHLPDGRIVNVFGDGERVELEACHDHQPLRIDATAVERLRATIRSELGLKIPVSSHHWAAVKTELIPVDVGYRSQAHHACLVPGISNAWLAIPGKLSQSAALSYDLAKLLLRRHLDDDVAHPIFEDGSDAGAAFALAS